MRVVLFILLSTFLFFSGLNAQHHSVQHLSIPITNCKELSQFTTEVLDSSYFFKEGVVSTVSKTVENATLETCSSYPFLLTISGFQNLINNNVLGSRSSLLKAEALYAETKQTNSKYYVRNKIFLGLNYNQVNDTLKSLQYLFRARDLSKQIGDNQMLADALQNIGLVYLDNNVFKKAKINLDQAVYYGRLSNNKEILAFSKLTISRLLQQEEKWDAAMIELAEAEKIFIDLNQKRNQYFIEHSKAELYEKMGQYDKSIERLKFAIALGDKSDHKMMHGLLYYELGELVSKTDKKKSILYYERAFDNSSSLDDKEFEKVVNMLTDYYVQTKNLKKLDLFAQKLSGFYATRKEMIEVELSESHKLEIAIQKEIAANQILRLNDKINKRIIWIVAIASLICLCFAFYAFSQLKKNQKLNKKIKIQNDQLGRQNIELRNFAFMASHDLKAPAKSIYSFASLLMKKEAQSLDPSSLKYIEIIKKSSEDMNRLVTSLLEFSNVENSQTEFKPFSPDLLLQDVQNNLFSLMEESRAKIEIVDKLPTRINGDESKLKIVFQNLLNNAIKFVPAGKLPRVLIRYNREANFHVFSIEDNGIGIPKEFLDKVFLMFQRLNSTAKYEGSGIGLATCKKIVLLHNGKIEIQSSEGIGTIVNVYLPV